MRHLLPVDIILNQNLQSKAGLNHDIHAVLIPWTHQNVFNLSEKCYVHQCDENDLKNGCCVHKIASVHTEYAWFLRDEQVMETIAQKTLRRSSNFKIVLFHRRHSHMHSRKTRKQKRKKCFVVILWRTFCIISCQYKLVILIVK